MAKKCKSKKQAESGAISQASLLDGLHEDLIDAFHKLKEFALELGPQRSYASGKAIMFSRDVCYFFVRPKKSYLEVVVMLPQAEKIGSFHKVVAVSKSKWAHTFKLVHADQAEGELTEAVAAAYSALA